MPGFDGTGPAGRGPMTGRARGFCVVRIPDETNPTRAVGFAGMAGRPFAEDELIFQSTGKEVDAMPWGDGTGPAGMGPMTGRAAGYCAGYPVPGYMNPIPGRGFGGRGRGMGRGRGRGWGRGAWAWGSPGYAPVGAPTGVAPYAPAAPTRDQELEALKGQAEYLAGALEDIKARMGELEAAEKSGK